MSISNLQELLYQSIDSTPQKVAAFFKTGAGDYAEHDQFIGITVPTLRKIAQQFSHLTLEDLAILIRSPINEERLLSLIMLSNQYKKADSKYQEEIYQFYLKYIDYVNNWNLVDNSAHLIIGTHLVNRNRNILAELAKSTNLWKRRISIVATWHFTKQNDVEWTFIIANLLCTDHHDLIHKAVGWMLREAGKKDTERLTKFLTNNAHKMPKTMIRYAMEHLHKSNTVLAQ